MWLYSNVINIMYSVSAFQSFIIASVTKVIFACVLLLVLEYLYADWNDICEQINAFNSDSPFQGVELSWKFGINVLR